MSPDTVVIYILLRGNLLRRGFRDCKTVSVMHVISGGNDKMSTKTFFALSSRSGQKGKAQSLHRSISLGRAVHPPPPPPWSGAMDAEAHCAVAIRSLHSLAFHPSREPASFIELHIPPK